MGSTLISYPDRTMEAATTLSGGSYQVGMTLASLQNALLSKVARSADALAASTQFVVTCNTPKDVRVIALLGHNISLAGTIRVRGYSDAGLTVQVYDTGTQYAWPQAFTSDMIAAYPNNWIWPTQTIQTARYWKVEIVDTANAAGYVQLGRCWLGPALELAVGIADGATLGYESGDTIATSLGGVDFGNRRDQRRSMAANFDTITDPLEKRAMLIMQKTLGKVGEIMWISNKLATPDDMLMEAFPAKVRKANPLLYPYFGKAEAAIEVLEIV